MRIGSTALELAPPRQYAVTEANQSLTVVTTSRKFPASADLIWKALLFYEEIEEPPSFLLGRFVPKPINATGDKFEVGGEVKCRYSGGHLLKRITHLTHPQMYVFEVIEQELGLRGIRLLGGEYTLFSISPGRTRVTLTTRYSSSNQPQWLCHWIEVNICHSFHRYILNAIQKKLARRDLFEDQ